MRATSWIGFSAMCNSGGEIDRCAAADADIASTGHCHRQATLVRVPSCAKACWNALLCFISLCGTSRDLGLLLTGSTSMQRYNYEFRGLNKPTDILAFPFHEVCVPHTPYHNVVMAHVARCPAHFHTPLADDRPAGDRAWRVARHSHRR